MARFELKLPKMGGVAEATITNWLEVGIELKLTKQYLKIATDKVDS
jgi:hypothetical protein